MIPYNIIWEEEISSDSLENQDSPRTNLVNRPLTEDRQMPSTPSPVAEVCAETSESPPTNEEECRKCKRREENSNGVYPKKIKNVDLTKTQEYSVSPTYTDASDSMDHLDSPHCTTKEQEDSVSSNDTDASDSKDHLDSPPFSTEKQEYSFSPPFLYACDSMDLLDPTRFTTKKQKYSVLSTDTDASDSMDHTPPCTTIKQEDSGSSKDTDASDSMECLDTPPF